MRYVRLLAIYIRRLANPEPRAGPGMRRRRAYVNIEHVTKGNSPVTGVKVREVEERARPIIFFSFTLSIRVESTKLGIGRQ